MLSNKASCVLLQNNGKVLLLIQKRKFILSKRLERLLDLIEAERLNDGSRTKKEIEFELAWKKFIYSHKMPKDIDVIFETFNYLN